MSDLNTIEIIWNAKSMLERLEEILSSYNRN